MYITGNGHLPRLIIVALVVMIALAGFFATQVRAAEVQVETAGELIAAITAANASGEPTVIVLSEGGDYVLTSVNNTFNGSNGMPVIRGDITIRGNGATIRRRDTDSTGRFRIFAVDSMGKLNLVDVTLSDGWAYRLNSGEIGAHGGGILNYGNLELTDSIVTGNSASYGGGIHNRFGTLILTDSTVELNDASQGGGGIYNWLDGSVTLKNSTVSHNSAVTSSTAGGGGILNRGTLTLVNSTVSANSSRIIAGGVYNVNTGSLQIVGSTISNNNAGDQAGGIYNSGRMMMFDSLVAGNSVENEAGSSLGGGIVVDGPEALGSIFNSTISGNSAMSPSLWNGGGGIYNGAELRLTNSTVSANHADSFGGGLFNRGVLSLNSTTVAGNNAGNTGGGIAESPFSPGIVTTLVSTLITGNEAGAPGSDFSGVVSADSSYNMIGDVSGMTGIVDGEHGNIVGADPLLVLDPAGLDDNGGSTKTIALLAGSPAIDAIPVGASGCGSEIDADQRGIERPQGDGCDIGAFELVPDDPDPLPTLTITASSHTMTYGDPVPGVTPSYDGFVNGDTSDSLLAQPVCSTTATSNSDVGAYETSCSGAESFDYEIHFVAGELVVDARPITVTADSHFKLPGEDDPDLNYQVSGAGLVADDELTGELERDPGEEPGTYQIAQGSLAAGPNYVLTFVGGTLTIGYDVCLDFDNSKVKKTGSILPIRLMLCDSDANNISSDGITLAATSLMRISSWTSGEMDPTSAGNANPDGDFRFADDRYIYNLNTKGMSQGTWQMTFTVNGSESPNYRVEFQLAR